MYRFKLGVTTHSYGAEWVDRRATLEDMYRHAAELGLDGIEIVETAMFPDYPYVSDEYAGELKRLERAYGVHLVALSANMDRGKRPDRDLDDREKLKIVLQDLQNANRLECPVLKSQYLISPRVMQRAAVYAEQYGVILTIEIHNPETPTTPIMAEYFTMFEETGSDFLGFVPDFGMLANRPNRAEMDRAVANGARQEIIDFAIQLRYDEVPREDGRRLMAEKGALPMEMGLFESMYGYMQFTKTPDFDGLRKIMKYCPHMHGKFIDILDDGTESTIPYPDVLRVLAEEEYSGYIVSEFEGNVTPERSSFQFVREHIEMQRRILESL